jgi:hypothetical protein
LTENQNQDSVTHQEKSVLPGKEISGLKETIEQLIEEGQFTTIENILRCREHHAGTDDELIYDLATLNLIMGDLRMLQQDITNVIMRLLFTQFRKEL